MNLRNVLIILVLAVSLLVIWLLFGVLSETEDVVVAPGNDLTEALYTPGQKSVVIPGSEEEVYLPEGNPGVIRTDVTEKLTKSPDDTFDSVLDTVFTDYYSIVPCEYGGEKSNVLTFPFKYSLSLDAEGREAVKKVRFWEADILQDLGGLIFDDASESELDTLLTFEEVDVNTYKSKSIVVGGENTRIVYRLDYDSLYVGTSEECIEAKMFTVLGGHMWEH